MLKAQSTIDKLLLKTPAERVVSIRGLRGEKNAEVDMRAVGHVVLNRVISYNFPDTVCDVVWEIMAIKLNKAESMIVVFLGLYQERAAAICFLMTQEAK